MLRAADFSIFASRGRRDRRDAEARSPERRTEFRAVARPVRCPLDGRASPWRAQARRCSEMATPAATTASGTLPSLSLLPWLLLAVIAGAGIPPLLAGKREEALGKLQCEAQLSEARGKLVFLERSSETDAQRMRQLQEELAAVKQSEQQLRREAEMQRNATPEQTLPEQLRALMEVQHLLTNVPQARL